MSMKIGPLNGDIHIHTVKWVIKNAKRLPSGIGDCISSPNLYTDGNYDMDSTMCKLSLFPQGSIADEAGYVSIHGQLNNYSWHKLHVERSTFQTTNTPSLICTYKGGIKDKNERKIRRSELLRLCDSNDEFSIIWKIDNSVGNLLKTGEADEQEGQLSQAFRPLFKESKFSDVAVIVGDQKFPAHKLVLAARSSVFSAMFENKESQENLKNEVKIEEMEPAVVEAMLEFFYTDEVTNLEELAYGLLAAAEQYDVQRLKRMCEKVLYKILNKDNVAEILIHADAYRSHGLKEHAMRFMADRLFEVVETESYKVMEQKYPELLKELIRTVALQQKAKK